MRVSRGFSLIELMIVVVVIGLLAAIAIPNFLASETRAREANVKSNMHTFQLAAEDFKVRGDSTYAGDAADVAPLLVGMFRNPFDRTLGAGNAWEDRSLLSNPPSPRPGIVSYSDSLFGLLYNIKGQGLHSPLTLVLSNGN